MNFNPSNILLVKISPTSTRLSLDLSITVPLKMDIAFYSNYYNLYGALFIVFSKSNIISNSIEESE